MVDDWFDRWLGEHIARHDRAGLPAVDSEAGIEQYDGWRSNFVHRGVSDYDVATEASRKLMGETLRHSSQHFPRLVEIAVGVYKARNAAESSGGVDPESFEAARFASRDCPYCSGNGLAVAYDMEPGPLNPETVGAHCVCPAGRWMRKTIGAKDASLLRRIPDFDQVLDGRTRWSAVPPIEPDAALSGCADPAAMFAALKRKLAAHTKLPRTAPPAAARPSWPSGDPIIEGEPAYAPRRD